MDASELEKNITEFEEKLDRLRALYEQYFCGIEKLEPQVPRKDLDRRIMLLRKEHIRNTAMRFKFNTLVQRYSTLQQHWGRVLREIENGTYKRDLARAAARFGVDEALTAVGKKRAERLAKGLAAQLERQGRNRKKDPEEEVQDVDDAELLSDDVDDDAPTPPPRRGGAQGESALPVVRAYTLDEDDDGPRTDISRPGVGPAPAHPSAGGWAPPPGYPAPQGYPQPGYAHAAHQQQHEHQQQQHAYAQQQQAHAAYAQQQAAYAAQQHAWAAQQAAARGGAAAPPGYPDPAQFARPSQPHAQPAIEPPPPSVGSRAAQAENKPKGGLRLGGGPAKRASADALSRIASSLGDGVEAPAPASVRPQHEAAPAAPPPAPAARRPLMSSPIDLDLPPSAAPDLTPRAPQVVAAPAAAPAARRPGLLAPPPRADTSTGAALKPPPKTASPAPAPVVEKPAPTTEKLPPVADQPSAPTPAESAPQRPAARPAAAAANALKPPPRGPAGKDDLNDTRLREIYSQYVNARRERNESTAGITFEKLADSLRSQAEKLRSKHTAKKVDYEVVVKDGKTLIKPIVK